MVNKQLLLNKEKYVGTIWESKSYGEFEIVSYSGYEVVKIRFITTGYETTVQLGDVRRGRVKDKLLPNVCGLGYIGIGKYKPYENGKDTKSYKVWNNMIHRCYNPKSLLSRPTYKDCTVTREWHNFQNFAKWFEENYIEGCDLDKDIKVDGNKVYGPDTCMFVSTVVNTIKSKANNYIMLSSKGEVTYIYNMAKFCRDNGLNASAMYDVNKGKRNHHKGWTKYE